MILEKIVADNKLELKARKRSFPLAELQRVASEQPAPLNFAAALGGERVQLIAEVKKAIHELRSREMSERHRSAERVA